MTRRRRPIAVVAFTIILIVGAVGGAAQASGIVQPDGVSQSPGAPTVTTPAVLDSAYQVRVVPTSPGFNPFTATNTELWRHGLPMRPNTSDGLPDPAWGNAVSHAERFVVATLVPVTDPHARTPMNPGVFLPLPASSRRRGSEGRPSAADTPTPVVAAGTPVTIP